MEETRPAQSQLTQSQLTQSQLTQSQLTQSQLAEPLLAPLQPAQRQLVVWRGDQVPVQHGIPGPGDLRDDTNTGRLLIGSLVRAQLGLSLMCLMLALTVTVSFPLVAALVPAIGRTRVAGLPVTLIVLGFAFYPVFLAIGWFYHRQARQLEARFTDLVDPPDD